MISVTRPSLPMRMNAFGAKADRLPSAAAARTPGNASRCQASRNPPPAAALAKRSWRRDIWPMSALLPSGGRFASRQLDRLADTRVRAAAADVPGHSRVDVGVGGRRYLREQRCSRHDLTGLAVAALNDLEIEPG